MSIKNPWDDWQVVDSEVIKKPCHSIRFGNAEIIAIDVNGAWKITEVKLYPRTYHAQNVKKMIVTFEVKE